jgi:hypothetical protein
MKLNKNIDEVEERLRIGREALVFLVEPAPLVHPFNYQSSP